MWSITIILLLLLYHRHHYIISPLLQQQQPRSHTCRASGNGTPRSSMTCVESGFFLLRREFFFSTLLSNKISRGRWKLVRTGTSNNRIEERGSTLHIYIYIYNAVSGQQQHMSSRSLRRRRVHERGASGRFYFIFFLNFGLWPKIVCRKSGAGTWWSCV